MHCINCSECQWEVPGMISCPPISKCWCTRNWDYEIRWSKWHLAQSVSLVCSGLSRLAYSQHLFWGIDFVLPSVHFLTHSYSPYGANASLINYYYCVCCNYILCMTSPLRVYDITTSCVWRHLFLGIISQHLSMMSPHLVNDVATLCGWCHHILRLVEFNQNDEYYFYSFILLFNSCVRLCVLEQEQECSELAEHALIVYATC